MKTEAFAKINIGLIVGKKGDDGLHDIESYMALIDLHDTLDIEIEDGKPFSVSIERDIPYIKDGEEDLMEKSARLFALYSGKSFKLKIKIEKKIPSKAGLGGGSADAAAVLRFLCDYYRFPECSTALSLSVGSDVPFLVSGYKMAFVKGRGEWIEKREGPGALPLLIYMPSEGVETKGAYSRLDAINRPIRHLPPLSFPSRSAFPNDFELIQTHGLPEVFNQENAFISLTGSGSGWYALFEKNEIIPSIEGTIRANLLQ